MTSQKISQFNVSTSLSDSDLFTFVVNGTNKSITYSDLKTDLGVTGTIEQDGNPLATPVLDFGSGGYKIRNIEASQGISASVSAENGIALTWNVSQDATGVALTDDVTATKPVISSLVAGAGTTITKANDAITIATELPGVDIANAGDVYIADGVGGGAWLTVESIGSGAAAPGSMLVSDGAGNLTFARYQGWGQWQDTDTTVGAPSQTLTSGVRTLWTNDGGTLTVQKSPTDLINPLWNTTTNKIQPIAAFDVYQLRVSFTAENYAGTTPYIQIELDIGAPIGVITERDISLRKGGSAQEISAAFPFFAGDTFFANGGEIYITYQGTGTCDIYKSNVLLVRESKNFV